MFVSLSGDVFKAAFVGEPGEFTWLAVSKFTDLKAKQVNDAIIDNYLRRVF
jgi:hypothetical protein